MHRPRRRMRPPADSLFMVDDERVLLVEPTVRLGLEFQSESAVDSLPGIDNITISATPSSHSNYETDALNSILAGDDASPFSSFPVSVGHRLFCLSLLLGKPLEERVIAYAGDFG